MLLSPEVRLFFLDLRYDGWLVTTSEFWQLGDLQRNVDAGSKHLTGILELILLVRLIRVNIHSDLKLKIHFYEKSKTHEIFLLPLLLNFQFLIIS